MFKNMTLDELKTELEKRTEFRFEIIDNKLLKLHIEDFDIFIRCEKPMRNANPIILVRCNPVILSFCGSKKHLRKVIEYLDFIKWMATRNEQISF